MNVPDDSASVWIQGQQTQATGKQRVFVTPSLEPGFNYSYEIRVHLETGKDETRTVQIGVGQPVVVDFSRVAEKLTPPTKVQPQ